MKISRLMSFALLVCLLTQAPALSFARATGEQRIKIREEILQLMSERRDLRFEVVKATARITALDEIKNKNSPNGGKAVALHLGYLFGFGVAINQASERAYITSAASAAAGVYLLFKSWEHDVFVNLKDKATEEYSSLTPQEQAQIFNELSVQLEQLKASITDLDNEIRNLQKQT